MKFPMVEKEGKAPILYTKLMYSEKTQKIHTLFHSKEKSKENPLDYLDQYMKVKMAIVIDSIYISDDSVSVQLRLHDVYVKPLPQRLPMVTLSPEEESEDSAGHLRIADIPTPPAVADSPPPSIILQ